MKVAEYLSVRGILESNTLVNALTEEQMVFLASQSRIARCEKGEQIWVNHRDVGFFGIVGAGFIKMVKSCPGGAEVTLEIMGPSQMFGLLGVIDGTGCPLMAYGMSDTVYLKVPKAALLEVYGSNHIFKDRLVRKTALRIHQKLDFISMLASAKADARIAAVLFILAESYGKPIGDAIRLELPLTRQQIGEMAGTTTETTIRVISRWTRQGLIVSDHQCITINAPEVLLSRPSGQRNSAWE